MNPRPPFPRAGTADEKTRSIPMEFRPILSTLMRHKIAALLIVLEIALSCAIVCNALFLIGERLDRPQPCYSLSQACTCTRVRQGDVVYDTQLGYPLTIAYRREIRPNLLNIDYWRRLLIFRQLPNCGIINQNVRIAVTALTPLQ